MSKNTYYGEFAPDKPAGQAIHKWWNALQENAGERATLRRAKNTLEVAMQPAYYRLLSALAKENLKIQNLSEKLAYAAGLLAHVKEHRVGSIARFMNLPKENPKVSDLRFRRVLRIEDRDELYVMMIRFLRMLDGKADIYDLTHSVISWNDRIKKEWASQYFLSQDFEIEQNYNSDNEVETEQKKGA